MLSLGSTLTDEEIRQLAEECPAAADAALQARTIEEKTHKAKLGGRR